MLRAGKRQFLIVFERATEATSALGGESDSAWVEVEQAKAAISWGSGAERRESAAENASQTATFRVLSTAALRGVTPRDHRILYEGAGWDITGIAPVGDLHREIEFTASLSRG